MPNENEIIVESLSNRIIEDSPSVQEMDTEGQQELEAAQAEAFRRYESSLKHPDVQGDVEGKADDRVMLTESDDYLPYLAEIGNQVNIGKQQLDDERDSIIREPGTWDGKYVKPGQKTINGIDFVTGEKLKNVYDLPDEDIYRGLEKLRQGRYSMLGGDVTALEGATDLAGTILENGGTFADFQHIISEAGLNEQQQRLAYQAADEAMAQEELSEYLYGDVDMEGEEVAEAREDLPEPEYEREDLPNVPEWMQSAQTLYKYETGGDFTGSPEELVDWSVNEMANFNWRILGADFGIGKSLGLDAEYRPTSMSWYGVQALKNGPEYAKALHNLIEMYDRVNTDMGIFGSSLGAFASDVTTWSSLGVGKLASMATANVAKARLKNILAQTAARAAPAMAAGSAEGAAFVGGEEFVRQTVGIEAGLQEGYDAGEIGKKAALGGAVGLGAGVLLSEPAVEMYKKGGRKLIENYKASQPVGPLRRQIGAVGNVRETRPFQGRRPNRVSGGDKRISTRLPYGRDATEDPSASLLSVGMEAQERDPVALSKIANKVRDYMNARESWRNLSDEQVLEKYKDHIKDNLRWLHDQMDPELRARAKQWYDGARRRTAQWAADYDLDDSQVAGVIAVLSPQKDWYMNMSLAERILDINKNHGDHLADDAMDAVAQEKFLEYRPKDTPETHQLRVDAWNNVKDKTFNEIEDDYEAAMWLRAYDEAHNTRRHRVWSPEGDLLDYARNKGGGEKKVGWGSLGEIKKAVSVLRDGSLENISQQMGGAHKVRNFYNNIVSPNSNQGEVTVDTHAVAAALLQPLSGSGTEVMETLSGVASAKTGSAGLYPLMADAYRETAAELGILPRELQSIVWEEVRTLFTDVQKRDKKLTAETKKVWDDYKSGKISQQKAREKIYGIYDGTGRPAWADQARPSRGSDAGKRHSTYREELPADNSSRQGGGAGDSGGAGDDAARNQEALTDPAASQKTQVVTTTGSYVKAANALDDMGIEGATLDYGAGRGLGTEAMGADDFEPFPQDIYGQPKGTKSSDDFEPISPKYTNTEDIPSESYERVVSLNVLNVVEKPVRDNIVQEIGRVLKPGGGAIIGTRGWKGDIAGTKFQGATNEDKAIVTKDGSYQKGFDGNELVEYLQEQLGDGFTVERCSGIAASCAKVRKL